MCQQAERRPLATSTCRGYTSKRKRTQGSTTYLPHLPSPVILYLGAPGWPEGKPTPGTTCTGNCPDGDDCECVHEIDYLWNTGSAPMRFIYAGYHCHALPCIKMELYRNDTGELLCRQVPIHGQGRVDVDT